MKVFGKKSDHKSHKFGKKMMNGKVFGKKISHHHKNKRHHIEEHEKTSDLELSTSQMGGKLHSKYALEGQATFIHHESHKTPAQSHHRRHHG